MLFAVCVGNYLHGIHHLDVSLARLFAGLAATGLAETTAVALYGVAGSLPGVLTSLPLILVCRALLGLSVGGLMTTAAALIAWPVSKDSMRSRTGWAPPRRPEPDCLRHSGRFLAS